MSHFSTLQSKLTNGELLQTSLHDLGMTVKTNARVRGLCGQSVHADIMVVLDGECDLGWSRRSDGSFALVADLWGVARRHDVAKLMTAVNQKYAVNQTLAAVKRPGLQQATVKLQLQA
jgi:hypothetical protein